ncbi:MAG: ester cyclase [Chloroflexi bacterium]|nr:ester cyclase [Chloroflexota bacterium]
MMSAEGDDIIVRLTIRGTHRGVYRGLPPTGNSVRITRIERLRLVNGRIARVLWHHFEKYALLHQMGALPTY